MLLALPLITETWCSTYIGDWIELELCDRNSFVWLLLNSWYFRLIRVEWKARRSPNWAHPGGCNNPYYIAWRHCGSEKKGCLRDHCVWMRGLRVLENAWGPWRYHFSKTLRNICFKYWRGFWNSLSFQPQITVPIWDLLAQAVTLFINLTCFPIWSHRIHTLYTNVPNIEVFDQLWVTNKVALDSSAVSCYVFIYSKNFHTFWTYDYKNVSIFNWHFIW